MTTPLYYRYWGKADEPLKMAYCLGRQEKPAIAKQFKAQLAKQLQIPESQINESHLDEWAGKVKWERGQKGYAAYHLLVYHCLDVAAVGNVLLEQHPFLANRFEQLFGMDKPLLMPWLNLLIAMHDCGKFAESFQQLNPELRIAWWGEISKPHYDLRHDSLGFVLWEDEDAIRKALSINMRFYRQSLKIWLQATTGHHGLPPKNKKSGGKITAKTYFKETDINSAADFYRDAQALFNPDIDSLSTLIRQEDWLENQEKASWLLAGFTILCDWLGSDSAFFHYCADDSLSLADYWQKYALPSAELAIKKSGLLPAQAGKPKTLQQLFSYLQTPTPLQQQAAQLPLTATPQLLILEDVTGAGKTEAALMIAQRLISQGLAQGVFIGLPTMATANAMYSRAADCYGKLYADHEQPSLVLAHSARHLSEKFKQSIIGQPTKDAAYGQQEASASVQCARWLSDHRKKALLADVGIGTIDQVLLGILPARHQSLRLLGLVNKVLIIDEVHAYDAYMNRLLQTLLEFHAFLGGSAVLLSATLPLKMRQDFVKAFERGAGYTPARLQKQSHADYPLLTHISNHPAVEKVVETRPEVKRAVSVKFIHDPNDAIGIIKTAVSQQQCVCWIRNTVFDARTAYYELQHADWLNADQLLLFHSRYILQDRKTLEDEVLMRFSKHSTAAMRQGKVIISTQVVEQSLDIDMDVIISDLAPIDLIVQRAGRLYRHCRDAQGNPIEGEDLRPKPPTLFIFSPPLTETPAQDWYKAVFPRANGVYPHTGQLWRTAQLLAKKQGWQMPEDAREMIETVYQNDDDDIPEALQKASNLAEGEHWAKTSLANMNALKLGQGYTLGDNAWDEDMRIPTRLSEDSVTVYLATWRQGRLTPLIMADNYAWDLSSLHIAANRIKAIPENLQQAVNELKANEKALDDYALVLPLTPLSATRWQGEALNADDKAVNVVYCQQLGLLVGNEIALFMEGQTE